MFKKTYLTLAMTRRMSGEHPVGDPFGGPPYGERNPPVAAAFAAVGAAVTVAETVVAVATLVSYAGIGLTVVGAVTGNKSLMKVGGVMGLVGGVGAIAGGLAGGGTVASINAGAASAEAAATNAAEMGVAATAEQTATATAAQAAEDTIAGSVEMGLPATTTQSLAGSENAVQGLLGADAASPGVQPLASASATAEAPAVTASKVADTNASSALAEDAAKITETPTSGTAVISDKATTAGATGATGTPTDNLLTPAQKLAAEQLKATQAAKGGFSFSDLANKLADNKSTGYLIQGAGQIFSGYSQGQAAEQQLDYQKGLLAQKNYNASYAGRAFA